MRVLVITSEWPTQHHPSAAPFIVQRVRCLCEIGIDVQVFPFRGNKNPINYLKAWFRLRKLYNMEDFDLIDAQFGQSGLLALPAKIPIIVTFHGSDLHGIVGKRGHYSIRGIILRFISRYIAKIATEVIVVSDHLKKFLPPGLSTHTIPFGVDLELFYPIPREKARQELHLPLDKKFVLFAANPNIPVKRYHLAQKAVRLLKNQFDVELITIYNLPHNVVPIYMNASDVLVLTSKHEGSPVVIKEALACNLPIVSVDVGDVRERIKGIEGCILCADDSPKTIADGLLKVLRTRRHIQGRDVVIELDERKAVKRVIDIYSSILSL